MIKKGLDIINIFLTKYLDIVGILFLVLNFLIWHTSNPVIIDQQSLLYQQGMWLVISALFMNAYRVHPKKLMRDNIFFIVIFALAIFNSFNIIMDFNGSVVDMGARSNILLMQAFPSFLFILGLYRYMHIKSYTIGLSVVLGILTIIALLSLLNEHYGLESFWFYTITSGQRHQSILNNPNALGEFSFIGIFIALFLCFISKKWILKSISLIPIPILFYALILSGSRTALLMTGSVYILMLLYFGCYQKNNKLLLTVFSGMLIILGVLVYMGFFETYVEMIRSDFDFSGRDTIWFNTLSIIESHNIRGIGYNNFTYVYHEMFGRITSPHNMLLGINAELGNAAVILVVGWFSYILIRNHNAIIKEAKPNHSVYFILFNAFYITYFIGQLTEYSFLKISTINTFFLAMQGVNFYLLDLENHKDKSRYTYLIAFMIIGLIVYFGFLHRINDVSLRYLYMLIYGLFYFLVIIGYEFSLPIINKIHQRKNLNRS